MGDRLPGSSTSNPIEYRSFNICCDPPPIPDRRHDWQGQHEDHEDAMCYGSTLPECKADVDRWHEEDGRGDDGQFGVGA